MLQFSQRFTKFYTLKSILVLGCLIRVLFVFLMGDDHHRLATDSYWILEQADKALVGNFNFDDGRFIIAPFYPVFVAGIKLIFSEYWEYVLSFIQISLSISSIYFIYLIANRLFKDVRVAKLSAFIISVFPFSFWWINTFSTESFFQGVFIISIFYLIKSYQERSFRFVFYSSILFSICFLTKSHVLMFSPFIVLYFFLNKEFILVDKIKFSAIYGIVCLVFTLPFGLYNLKVNNTYVLASNGAKYHFYTGNSEYGYNAIAEVPEQGTYDFEAVTAMRFGYFHGAVHDQMLNMTQDLKQEAFFNYSLDWIKNNPMKFVELKLKNSFYFFFPGVSYRHYPLMKWLFSFVISFPIYLFAYFGLIKAFKTNKSKHAWIMGLLGSMLLFSVIWYTQNRFRTITLEPFYFIYSSFGIVYLWDSLKKRSKITLDK